MKIKVWTDSNNRLLSWAYADEKRPVGPTDEGFDVIEVDDAVGLYENHASIVDGKVVPDADYAPTVGPSTIPESPNQQLAASESYNQQLIALKQSNDELQSALLELSDLVLSGGGSK